METEAAVAPEPEPTQPDGDYAPRSGRWLLVVLALLAATYVTLVLSADLSDIVDDGWREAAYLASAVGLVFLGLAFIAVILRVVPDDREWSLARGALVAAVVTSIAAVIAVGLAQEQGGTSSAGGDRTTIVTDGGAGESEADEAAGSEEAIDTPVDVADALDPEQMAAAALPVDASTSVTLDLNREGRRLAADALGCRPNDFRGAVIGIAIGGTWAQPLVLVARPFNNEGNTVQACTPAIMRLPLEAGVAIPS